MTATPEHDTTTDPSWIVQSVFDNEEPWRDFAYTIGLADLDRPELHIYCHPSLGDDPAPDWRFSSRDLCGLLNEVGRRLLARTVRIGDSWTREYDNGLVKVTFRLDPPGDREELEAFGVAEDVAVLPLRWSLERAPRGERRALLGTVETGARKEFAALRSATPTTLGIPRNFRPPRAPEFGVDQRYGPRTPLVQARAASIWASDDGAVTALLMNAVRVDLGGSITHPAALAAAEGRPLGLDDALETLRRDVIDAVHAGCPGGTVDTWPAVVDRFEPEADHRPCQRDQDRLARSLLHLFADALLSILSVEVLGCDADRETRVAGLGPWLCARERPGVAPGPDWLASDSVVGSLTGFVSGLDPLHRVEIARRHESAYARDQDYSKVVDLLLGWSITGAAASPPLPLVSPWWATTVAAALTYRSRLTNDSVSELVRPVRHLAPGLEDLLNRPL